ncbi:hypothetical protein KCP69_22020 [Salmonella enterica subsp. enterica]|nr:hypothetical protein KCP69_22020 [Salmonella enterica subsp. enterica]
MSASIPAVMSFPDGSGRFAGVLMRRLCGRKRLLLRAQTGQQRQTGRQASSSGSRL